MKIHIRILILLLALTMISTGPAQAEPELNHKEYVSVKDLNLRSKPDDTARPRAYLAEGQVAEYLGQSSNGWFKLSYQGKTGYTHRGDVTSRSNYESNEKPKIHNIAVSAANHREYKTVIRANLRTANADKYRSLVLMPEGSLLIHLGTTANGWFKVKYGETIGYIHRGDVTSKANYESSGDAKIHNVKLVDPANNREYLTIIDLNLRSGNTKNFRSVALLERGTSLIHLGRTSNGWFKVRQGEREGYIYRGDLTSRENYNRLQQLADKLDLEAKIKEAESLREIDYIEASWKTLKDALSHAKLVVEDKAAVQEEVNLALKDLEEAMDGLELDFEDGVRERILDIENKWKTLKPSSNEVEYIEKPKIKDPYILGKLTDETINNALKITNFVRYMAYLPSDIVIDKQFNLEAQAASLVNSANGSLTHYPKKPSKMDEDLYKLGSRGAEKSNIALGYPNIIDSIVDGYMNDGDPDNIANVGHRLWVLSPKLKKVGFGIVPSSSSHFQNFTAMRLIDDNMWANPYEPYDFISWPARTAMPVQYFREIYPWSVSLSTEKYSVLNSEDIKVELTRLNDNKTWHFSHKASDGFFKVSTGNYGNLPFTIIFRPEEKPDYRPGCRYRIKISNISTVDGKLADLNFETNFFKIKE